jgi:hypothetical protein
MTSKTSLKILFTVILLTMIVYTGYASTQQNMFKWGGMTGPDRYWTIATIFDAYFGFLTFYVWVFYKERRWVPRIAWFIGIMLLGNIAMASYVLLQLTRLRKDEPASAVLAARNA